MGTKIKYYEKELSNENLSVMKCNMIYNLPIANPSIGFKSEEVAKAVLSSIKTMTIATGPIGITVYDFYNLIDHMFGTGFCEYYNRDQIITLAFVHINPAHIEYSVNDAIWYIVFDETRSITIVKEDNE